MGELGASDQLPRSHYNRPFAIGKTLDVIKALKLGDFQSARFKLLRNISILLTYCDHADSFVCG